MGYDWIVRGCWLRMCEASEGSLRKSECTNMFGVRKDGTVVKDVSILYGLCWSVYTTK